jgi:hypothetical protein
MSGPGVIAPAVLPYSSITAACGRRGAASRPARRRRPAFAERPRFAGEGGGVHASAGRDWLQQVHDVQDAHDIIEAVAIDRDAGVPAARDLVDERLARHPRRHGDQLRPRHHHLPRRQVGEAEDAVQHLFLALLEHAGFLAGGRTF